MANVLFVKVNDRPADQAVSVQMYDAFLKSYQEANPNDAITEIDLYNVELPYYGNDALTGLYKQGAGYELTEKELAAATIANTYLDQFLAADKLVIAFPLWNFAAPAPLTTYISYLTQAGKTFKYTAEGPVGLVAGKKVVLLNARGGVYSEGPMAEIESAIRPLKATFGLFGVQTQEVIIEGHNQFKDRTAEIVAAGLAETAKVAAAF
ncbi:FMN-dependent NADH-azoreductase [Paenibacillus pectinilyticus]|uniref:FMN dependent NADH:quinone oxidoreductase n=1 Tax=Paenibacillus pectinilyticus TaxID=512399 RepID=A0A1C1A1T8_9BACL|nr:FMN-dependent NADH-azoreductase [Paenibacillus pectinilyticus]OCT14496.1 FMN-dependent NADH-azoreductase [Paenibacillus pectinilyticus]